MTSAIAERGLLCVTFKSPSASLSPLSLEAHTRQWRLPSASRKPIKLGAALVAAAEGADVRRPQEPWAAAGVRLQNLLSGVGNGEDEILLQMVEDAGSVSKLALAATLSALLLAAAAIICKVSDLDLAGGASLSVSSLHAAQIGILGSLPVIAARHLCWNDSVRAAHPGVDHYCFNQLHTVSPILNGMALWQVGTLLLIDCVPEVLLEFSACLGTLRQLAEHNIPFFQYAIGVSLPPTIMSGVSAGVALGLVAGVAGVLPLVLSGAPVEEAEVVDTAVMNADRYYRTMTGPGTAPADESASAFRAVCAAWHNQHEGASQVEAALAAGQVFIGGLLWIATGDLAAPMAAAVAGSAVEYTNVWRHMHTKPSRG